MLGIPHQPFRHPSDPLPHRHLLPPLLRDASLSVVCPGDLAVDGASGVGVVAEVDGQEAALLEGTALVEGPEGRFEGLDDVAGALDLGRLLALVGSGGDVGDFRDERLLFPAAGIGRVEIGEEIVLGGAVQGTPEEGAEVAAGVDGGDGAMGGAGAFTRLLDGLPGVPVEEHGPRGQAHEGAVAGGEGVRGTAQGVAGLLEGCEGGADRRTDVEALPVAAEVALAPPAVVALHLVFGIHAPAGDQALGQAEGHGRVVGPLARLQAEGAAAGHLRDGPEGAGGAELNGRPQGIADGEADETAAEAFRLVHLSGSAQIPLRVNATDDERSGVACPATP